MVGLFEWGQQQSCNDAASIALLSGILRDYVPWTSSAMKPGAVVKIINEVIINERRSIVEFGSGISTLYLAKVIKDLGFGRLVSIDHDESWIEKMSLMVERVGGGGVSFVQAPLVKTSLALDDNVWYREADLLQSLSGLNFDLVVVDGPFAYKKPIRRSRFPAIPFLHNYKLLSDSHVVFLDDALRSGEKDIMRRWGDAYGYTFSVDKSSRIAIAGTRERYNI